MAKHQYQVIVNNPPEDGVTIDYTFGRTACTMTCSKKCASLEFTMETKSDFTSEEFFQNKLVKDGLRKMYLLHAMAWNARLWIERITVFRGEESKEYSKETSPLFPFLFSMLTAWELKLPQSWQDEAFMKHVIDRPKYLTDEDPRYACLFSFLAGIGKSFEIERFTCYWTAMNAHYSYVYTQTMGKSSTNDAECIKNLLRQLECGKTGSTRAERTETYRDNFFHMMDHLCTLSAEDLEKLYRDLYAVRHRLGAVPNSVPEPLHSHLHQCINAAEYAAKLKVKGKGKNKTRELTAPINESKSQISAWGFLLLDYAYYMRCKYLHGNNATVLFSAANDPEVSAFRCLNVFLGNYLREAIPEMFRED